jgi:hypothetical protein
MLALWMHAASAGAGAGDLVWQSIAYILDIRTASPSYEIVHGVSDVQVEQSTVYKSSTGAGEACLSLEAVR